MFCMSLGVSFILIRCIRSASITTNQVNHICCKTARKILSGVSHCVWQPDCSATTMQKVGMHLGSRQFHYTESSCFSSGSRPLCQLPRTENWKHGTNNIMCYSNFAPGLVVRPSAVASVADHADVPASLSVFPRLLSLKLSRLHDRSAITAPNYFCYVIM